MSAALDAACAQLHAALVNTTAQLRYEQRNKKYEQMWKDFVSKSYRTAKIRRAK